MIEADALIKAYRQARTELARAALATVVRVQGSAYRRPGARMLITESGATTGLISGGCLDRDVQEHAARVMRSGRPVILKYDTTAGDDLVWGLGIGCNGIVDVLVEPVSADTDALIHFLETCSRSQERGASATVIGSERSDLPLGARVFLYPDGGAVLDVDARAVPIASHILTDLQRAVSTGVSSVSQYGAGEKVEAFAEVIEPRVPLFIFGAGPDVLPVVSVAADLGWHTTVIDTQARPASLERFAHADAVILCRPSEVHTHVRLTESAVVVLMTHNYRQDAELLPLVMSSGARYIGCLGPRGRGEQLVKSLPGTVWADDAEPLRTAPLRVPIGLDIGAESASEIALAIAAEILATIRGRFGGPLCCRSGAIHGDGAVEPPRGAVAV